MALAKTLATPYGVNAEYWRIIRVNKDFNGQAEVFLAGYASEAAREADNTPLDVRTIMVEVTEPNRDDLYPLIKASKLETRDTGEVDEEGNPITEEVETNDFTDAVNC